MRKQKLTTLIERICQFQDTSYDVTTFQFAASDAVQSSSPKYQLSSQSNYCPIKNYVRNTYKWGVGGNSEKIKLFAVIS
jgi:hypothetical protein